MGIDTAHIARKTQYRRTPPIGVPPIEDPATSSGLRRKFELVLGNLASNQTIPPAPFLARNHDNGVVAFVDAQHQEENGRHHPVESFGEFEGSDHLRVTRSTARPNGDEPLWQ